MIVLEDKTLEQHCRDLRHKGKDVCVGVALRAARFVVVVPEDADTDPLQPVADYLAGKAKDKDALARACWVAAMALLDDPTAVRPDKAVLGALQAAGVVVTPADAKRNETGREGVDWFANERPDTIAQAKAASSYCYAVLAEVNRRLAAAEKKASVHERLIGVVLAAQG